MLAHELYERCCIGLPVRRKPFELLEDGIDTSRFEELNGVFGVLVEIGIENALVHEVLVRTDIEQHPSQVMELQRGERVWARGDRVFDLLAVRADLTFGARLDLRDDGEAVAGGRPWVRRPVPALLEREVALLRNGRRR